MSEKLVRPGMVEEATQKVSRDLTAPHIGSGDLAVYATPAMVMLVERTCSRMTAALLPDGETTVGVEVRVRHLAPTPLGATVRIRAEVTAVDENIIDFQAQVWDPVELVGEAEHRRVVIDSDRFLRRVHAKLEQMDAG